MEKDTIRRAQDPLIFSGMEIVREIKGDGHIIIELEVNEDMLNPNGILHGGMTFTLSDMCAGLGAYCLGYKVATIQSSINYLRPVSSGKITAKNYVKHHGRTTMVSVVEIENEEGKLISTATFTMALLEKVE